MKYQWLHRQKADTLLLFCNGWGMDARVVRHLGSERYDVLMLYNYQQVTPELELNELLTRYKQITVVAWSMGVWAGQQLFKEAPERLASAIAINGTCCPIDDVYGIPQKTVQATLEQFNEKQRLKFYYRMCRDRKLYSEFLEIQPERTVEDQKQELSSLLQSAVCVPEQKPIYTKAIVADHDYIIPTSNQLQFWPEKMVERVDGSHFLFYAYKSWDAILASAGV